MRDRDPKKLNKDDLAEVKSLIGDAEPGSFTLEDILAEYGGRKGPRRSAVPVFPQISSPGNATPRDVPRSTERRIKCRTSSATSAGHTRRGVSSTPGPTCGGAKTPSFAIAAVNAATCIGVKSNSP